MAQPAAFIDFQGTLGGEATADIRDLILYPFAAEAIRLLNTSGVLAIGVTNQSHIAKGLLSWADYERELARVTACLTQAGARLDAVYCCPHDKGDNCLCKKPKTGMIDKACLDFAIDLPHSYVIGDMGMNDIVLAKNAGTRGILVLTGAGEGSLGAYRHTWAGYEADYIAQNVWEAAQIIAREISAS